MTKRPRSILIACIAALALLVLASPQHRATIRILAHRPGDMAPERLQAAVDFGLVGLSVLVTWSKRLAY